VPQPKHIGSSKRAEGGTLFWMKRRMNVAMQERYCACWKEGEVERVGATNHQGNVRWWSPRIATSEDPVT